MHNDDRYVHLGISDVVFTKRLNEKLKHHFTLASHNLQVTTFICTLHHVPIKHLQHSLHTWIDRFLTAFAENRESGQICLTFPKVKYVFCGHTHQHKQAIINGITAITVGCDY